MTKMTATAMLGYALFTIGCYDPQEGDQGAPGAAGQRGPQGPAGPPSVKGGERLKAKVITGEDGATIRAGLFDTKLGVDCAFMEAEDGKQRCLPAATAGATLMISGLGIPMDVYADSGCAQRLAVSDLCSPPLKYVKFTDTCGSRPRIAPITEMPLSRYYIKTTMCYPRETTGLSTRFYQIGAPMDPSTFVTGSVAME